MMPNKVSYFLWLTNLIVVQCNALKILPNGQVIVVEPHSNDLVVYGPGFDELLRLEGNPGDTLQNEALRDSRCEGGNSNEFIWFRGSGVISIVSCDIFFFQDISLGSGSLIQIMLNRILTLHSSNSKPK